MARRKKAPRVALHPITRWRDVDDSRTYVGLARLVGVDRSTISGIANGQHAIGRQTAIRIARATGGEIGFGELVSWMSKRERGQLGNAR